MRHYYRFMELEPVLEMEEDSVGDDSPTSSSGSPSFSPPPDVWAQLSMKEYQDSAYNMLLQDHLDLQRAYRLLEVQYRNCETRAARDVHEATMHVRNLKETLKEVLLSQETDKLLAMKEDLQRVKEKEAKLKEEVYDLREQNELLEFRILELEECHENTSIRSETRDVATQMDAPSVAVVETSAPLIDRYNAWIQQGRTLAESTTSARDTELIISNRDIADERSVLCTAFCIQTSESGLPSSSAVPPSIRSHGQSHLQGSMTRDACDGLQQRHESMIESTLYDTTSHPDITTNHNVEAISCTLCRTVPRRRSLAAVDGVEVKETLRKCKSDGEIKKMARDSDERVGINLKVDSVSNVIDSHHHRGDITCNRLQELSENIPTYQDDVYTGEQMKTMKSLLKSIYDILKETRIEVECTNSELREEVVTLETVVFRLNRELDRRDLGGNLGEEEIMIQPASSISSSKECHCCSHELRPSLEDVIFKLQQLAALINKKVFALNDTQDSKTDIVEIAQKPTELPAAIVLAKISTVLSETPVILPEVLIRKKVSNSLPNSVKTLPILTSLSNEFVDKNAGTIIDVTNVEASILEKTNLQTKLLIKEYDIDHVVDMSSKSLYNNIMMEIPVPDKNNIEMRTERLIYQLEYHI